MQKLLTNFWATRALVIFGFVSAYGPVGCPRMFSSSSTFRVSGFCPNAATEAVR